jgi:hypothetical protein
MTAVSFIPLMRAQATPVAAHTARVIEYDSAEEMRRQGEDRRLRLHGYAARRIVVRETPQARGHGNGRKTRDWLYIAPSLVSVPITPSYAWQRILEEVAFKHDVTAADIFSPRRTHKMVVARHEYLWRLRNETTLSLLEIGARCGGKDHSSVRNGILCHEKRLAGEMSDQPKRQESRHTGRIQAVKQCVEERSQIVAMIRAGKSNYAICQELGVGRIKINRIRKELRERGE